MSSKRLVPVIFAASLLIGSGSLANAVNTEEAILIPGAMPFKKINPVAPIVAQSYQDIGKFFRVGEPWQLVEYSQDPLAANRGLADGVAETVDAIDGTNGKVVVIGESMGSMVAWRAAEELAKNGSPRKVDISFVLIASPDVGISEYFKEGTYIPILNYTIRRVTTTEYDTTIVVGEYDGWSDPPDRPWNLVASANALAGIVYVHGPPSFTANVNALTPTSEVPRTAEHGKLTTYLVPTENLPLTQVFRDAGVPDALVDKADDVLRPIVDAGYVRHDKPGDTRPYLYDGEIHRNVQSQQQARETVQTLGANKPDVEQGRRAHPTSSAGELRQAVRTSLRDLRDRAEAGVAKLTKRITDRLTKREASEG